MTRTRVGWMFIVLMVAGIGCSDKASVPSGILAREDMQNVLWDMIQADQYSTTYLTKDSSHVDLKLENMRLYDQVFQLHHLSREKFSESYKYYMAHPDLTQPLLDSMLAMGNRLRTESYNRARTVSTPALTTVPATPPALTPNAHLPKGPAANPSAAKGKGFANSPVTKGPPAKVPAPVAVPKSPAQRILDSLHAARKRPLTPP